MKKLVILPIFLLIGVLAVFAGGGKEKTSDAGKQVINVGTMGTYEPFSFVDASDKITGYDLEVLRLIEQVDPSLHFEFHAGPWDSLFPGLDSDRFQLLANQIVRTPERIQKYSINQNTYHNAASQIIVKKGRTDITTLESLQGKKIGTTVGDSYTRFLEEWNAAHNNILTIVYYEEDVTTVLQDIVNGRIDATLNDAVMALAKAKAQGLAIEPVGTYIENNPSYFIAKKDGTGTALTEKLDRALSTLRQDGRLSRLSVEWFGIDYTK
jgi:L-cystine transport system substrate-binding protein